MTVSSSIAVRERVGLKTVDAWWRAANHLTVSRIYLIDHPLPREPILPEHDDPGSDGGTVVASPDGTTAHSG